MLFRRTRWLHRRVRPFILPPDVLAKRLEDVFAEFDGIEDATTREELFTPAAKKAAKTVLKMANPGVVSDHCDIPLYSLFSKDRSGLPLWL